MHDLSIPRPRSGFVQLLAAALLALACCGVGAQERLSQLFSDHMVMQRGMRVPVWGWAEPGETITVSIDAQTQVAVANAAGKWMVRLDPMQTGAPRQMTVKSRTETIEVNDILLGEVWLASGQSNMEWKLKQARDGPKEVAGSSDPQIRLFNVPKAIAPKAPVDRLPAAHPQIKNMNAWLPSSPDTAGEFSAVAYFFARNLRQSLNVPVGIISNAVGASAIEAWISHGAYLADPDFKVVPEYYEGLANYVENTAAGQKELAEVTAQYDAKQAALKAGGKPLKWPPRYPAPLHSLGYASTLYNAVVHPLAPYAIRGVIWYQGEAQSERMYEYRGIFPLLIKDWRHRWGQGNFPFVFVQLPNWARPNTEPDPGGWAFLRESQLLTLKAPNTAMAVTIDVGEANNIHPANKQDVGQRLALAARGLAYSAPITYSGPIYRTMTAEGNSIRLSFDHVGRGLMVGKKNGADPVIEDMEGHLTHFAIAGDDMKFVWADARIDRDAVVVSSRSVSKPVAVRYAWANNPDGCNLYNRDGLPASPFRTDESRPTAMGEFFRSRLDKGLTLRPRK